MIVYTFTGQPHQNFDSFYNFLYFRVSDIHVEDCFFLPRLTLRVTIAQFIS